MFKSCRYKVVSGPLGKEKRKLSNDRGTVGKTTYVVILYLVKKLFLFCFVLFFLDEAYVSKLALNSPSRLELLGSLASLLAPQGWDHNGLSHPVGLCATRDLTHGFLWTGQTFYQLNKALAAKRKRNLMTQKNIYLNNKHYIPYKCFDVLL